MCGYTGLGLLLFWFFLGGTIRSLLAQLKHGVATTPQLVDIAFGDSDAVELDGLRAFYRYEVVPIEVRVRDKDGAPVADRKPRLRIYMGENQVNDAGRRREVGLTYDESAQSWKGNWIPPYGVTGVYTARCSVDLPVTDFPEDYDWAAEREPPEPLRDPRLRLEDAEAADKDDAPRDTSAYRPDENALHPARGEREFRICGRHEMEGREPDCGPPGMGVVTWEILTPNLFACEVRKPLGRKGVSEDLTDWTGMFDWAQNWFDADTVWYSGYITSAAFGPLREGSPWHAGNTAPVSALGAEAHRRGMRLGVYAWAYKVVGPLDLLPDYTYAYRNEKTLLNVPSLLDERRVNDLAAAVAELNRNDNVDMIGFDYIRDAEPTFDAVNEFVRDVHPPVPEDWDALDQEAREEWLRGQCSDIASKTDLQVWRLWGWWRAHRVALNIRDIIERSECRKPLFAFTLSASHGMEHGQDPYMYQDAGADLIAPMLYQMPTQRLFEAYMTSSQENWRAYASLSPHLNLAPGNQVDYLYNQMVADPSRCLTDPPVPQRFYDRIHMALKEFAYQPRDEAGSPIPGAEYVPPVGVFCHDLQRASASFYDYLNDPYWGEEWALAGAAAYTDVRALWGRVPVSVTLETEGSPVTGETLRGNLVVRNITADPATASRGITVRGVSAWAVTAPGMQAQSASGGLVDIPPPNPETGEDGVRRIPVAWTVTSDGAGRSGWLMAAARAEWMNEGYWPHATAFRYVRLP